MRVVAGSARGVPLRVPRSDLRPTMDVVKGAIFSSLGELVPGARVLDLFAGTGALGIEALSRGAASVTFVESDRRAVATIRQKFTLVILQSNFWKSESVRFQRLSVSIGRFSTLLVPSRLSVIGARIPSAPTVRSNE